MVGQLYYSSQGVKLLCYIVFEGFMLSVTLFVVFLKLVPFHQNGIACMCTWNR